MSPPNGLVVQAQSSVVRCCSASPRAGFGTGWCGMRSIKLRWQGVVHHPRVAAMRRRLTPQLKFIAARLSPHGYPGLRLTMGVVLLIGASWLFGGIAEDVVTGDPLTVIDQYVAAWFHERRTSGLATSMQLVTGLASFTWVTGVTLIAALVLWWKRSWYRLLTLLLVLPGGMGLVFLLKIAFHRYRPGFVDSFLVFDGYSFPSGHTMAAMLLYGLLAVFVVPAIKSWRWRVSAVLGALVMVLLVGFSRVYLGAHYPSDVLAAAAAGMAWLAFSVTAVDVLRQRRFGQPDPGLGRRADDEGM